MQIKVKSEKTQEFEEFIDLSGELKIESQNICDDYNICIEKNINHLIKNWKNTDEV